MTERQKAGIREAWRAYGRDDALIAAMYGITVRAVKRIIADGNR
jgi:hypothetical protein